MIFNSWQFLLFFPIVAVTHFLIAHRYRWAFLLLASTFFYMVFNPLQILLILGITALNYVSGIYIERFREKGRIAVVIPVILNILVLFVFKYYNFFFDSLSLFATIFGLTIAFETLKIMVPLGLSYITFQMLSYIIEVFRGKQKAERHVGIFALSVLFFPKVLSGPIERPQDLLHQFTERHDFDYERVTDGMKIMAWGFFKKVVIADRLAIMVNQVHGNLHAYTGFALFLAVVFYTLQLYYDFSGYTDIAIGSARIMGFKLTNNFNRPFFAHSLTDFWRRWHITLSSWLRDYLYTPIVINRRYWGKAGVVLSLIVTFTICGLWHGASWNFVLFGLFNGIGLAVEFLTQKARNRFFKKLPAFIGSFVNISITFLYYSFTMIFFRAATVADSFYIITHIFSNFLLTLFIFLTQKAFILTLGVGDFEFKLALLLVVIVQALEFMQRRGTLWQIIATKPAWFRWGVYYAILLSMALFGVYSSKAQFIYFQF